MLELNGMLFIMVGLDGHLSGRIQFDAIDA
jgi:hypothetical protein